MVDNIKLVGFYFPIAFVSGNYTEAEPIKLLIFMEYLCVAWFTFEFFTRLFICAEREKFIRTPMNLIDLATVVPFYAETALGLFGIDANSLRRVTGWND